MGSSLWSLSKTLNFADFRPHRSAAYLDAAYCYRPSSVVCWSDCLSH